MRLLLIPCLAAMAVYLSFWSPATADPLGKGDTIIGEINFPEVSGATLLPGDRLLLAADEDNSVLLLEGATKSLLAGKVTPNELRPIDSDVQLDDIEAVAWDRASGVYVVTSHSLNRKGKHKPERHRIALLRLGADGKPKAPVSEVSQKVPDNLPQELRNATVLTPAQSGFNIEGAAWSNEGHLLLGLRSPTATIKEDWRGGKLHEDAVVLRLKNPQALFAAAADPLVVEEITLNLQGQGIRGMQYDPEQKGCWVLTGRAPDRDDDVRGTWALWLWEDGSNSLLRARIPDAAIAYLHNPEAVCRIVIKDRPYLLLIEDRGETSRYALFPVSIK